MLVIVIKTNKHYIPQLRLCTPG